MTLKRPVPQWRDREHLFTPANITKYEFAGRNEKRCPRSMKVKIVPKPLPNGPVITTYHIEYEDIMMRLGPQLPENRSEEPESFYLGKERP